MRQSNFKYGVFIFGGYSSATDVCLDDLWLLQPNTKSNETIVVDNQDEKSFYKDRDSAYIMGYNIHVFAFNIGKHTRGRAPIARYAHQACMISRGKYLVISGGRNNGLYKTMGNIAFNDMNLLNTQTLEWETMVMYGQVPMSRWNHCLVPVDEDRLLIFGGMNMSTYMHSSNLWVFEMGEYAVENFIAKANQNYTDLQAKIK